MLALDRYPEWMDMMKRVEYTTEVSTPEDKYRVGATAHGIPKGYEEFNCNFEITESVENEKITHRIWEKVYRGTLGFLASYILEPLDGGTELTLLGLAAEIPWGILGKILKPFWLIQGRGEYERSLENLKDILEK